MLWMMVNGFYDVVTMKVKWNWKSKFSLLFMDKEKLAKWARTAANNSICLYSGSFELNTINLQGNKSVLVAQLRKTLSSLESHQESAKQISNDAVAERKVI